MYRSQFNARIKMGDESGTVTIVLPSLDDVNKYYKLPRKGRKTSSNAALETFDPKNFDSNSKSNSFKTDQEVWAIGYLP